jgi:hypothetical protein
VSLRDSLAQRARPHLEPGEQIQAVFMAQSGVSPYWAQLIGFLVLIPLVMIYGFKLQNTPGGLVLLLILAVTLIVVSTLLFRTHHFVVTDRAITVLDASRWWATFPSRLRQRHPRNVYFGQLSGLYGRFMLGNTEYWVRRWRFRKDVAAADAALTAMMQRGEPGLAATAAPLGQQPGSLPPAGWYPDPTGGSDKRYWDGEQWAPAQQERFR